MGRRLRFGHHSFDVRNSIKQSKLCGCALIQHEYNDSDFSISRIPVNGCVNANWGRRVTPFPPLFFYYLWVLFPPKLGHPRIKHAIAPSSNPKNNRERKFTCGSRTANRVDKELGSDAGFDNLSGVIEAQAHHYSAAEAEFKRAIERQPRLTAAYLNLGRLYQENVSTDSQANQKALVIYDTVLGYEPGNAEANYQSALLLLEAGKYQASLMRVSRLPKTARESAQALSISCADYLGLGDHKNTSTVLAQLLKSSDFSMRCAKCCSVSTPAHMRM